MNVLYPLSYLPVVGREDRIRTGDHARTRRSNPWPCFDKELETRSKVAGGFPLREIRLESNQQPLAVQASALPTSYEEPLGLAAA